MADYDQEEVETSLTTIADVFHAIGQEYKKLAGVVPHMSNVQAANVIARMPILPFLKQEAKVENKQEPTMEKATEPVPSTSHEQSTMPEDARSVQTPTEEVREEEAEKEDDEPEAEVTDEYFKKYVLLGKGRDPKEKINEACKEINYHNLLVLIAVGDYTVNKAKNIQMVAKKWGLSFSAIHRAMSQKKEHSMGGRQYGGKSLLPEKKKKNLLKKANI